VQSNEDASAACRECCFNLIVRRTLSGSHGGPTGFDFLMQNVVVSPGFALSSDIFAKQIAGNLGRRFMRRLGLRHELIAQLVASLCSIEHS